jgi:hypothetical protein
VIYAKAFFDLHLEFAQTVAALSGLAVARARLGRQSSLEGLDGSFPFQVLSVEAPLPEFYRFYGL